MQSTVFLHSETMVFHIYVGSYTNEIYTLAFDPDAPSLTLVSTLTVGFHPSWLAAHPTDPSVVFAGIEQTEGEIVAVKFDEAGHGSLLGRVSSGGASPCSLVAADAELLIGNVRTSLAFHSLRLIVHLSTNLARLLRSP